MTSSRQPWELPISECQLRSLTRELSQAHHETIPVMAARIRELSEELAGAQPQDHPVARQRRAFLTAAGGAALGFALAGCGEDSAKKVSKIASASPTVAAVGAYPGDLRAVALAVALENQALGAYQAALAAAQAGKLGTVPAALETFTKTAMSQHAEHARAWNSVLQGAGKQPIMGTPLNDQQSVTDAVDKVSDVTGLARLALRLEDQATQTYLSAQANVQSKGAIAVAATIAPVEAMHAAILNFVLGQYPVPGDFIGIGMAASPNLLTV